MLLLILIFILRLASTIRLHIGFSKWWFAEYFCSFKVPFSQVEGGADDVVQNLVFFSQVDRQIFLEVFEVCRSHASCSHCTVGLDRHTQAENSQKHW
jgi:hypothetical protein